jgi:hypothetical protein
MCFAIVTRARPRSGDGRTVLRNDRLSAEEIAALLEQRQLADDTHHCSAS